MALPDLEVQGWYVCEEEVVEACGFAGREKPKPTSTSEYEDHVITLSNQINLILQYLRL
jgi:hypothetical protein